MTKKCKKLGNGQHFDDFIYWSANGNEPIRLKRIYREMPHYLFLIRMANEGRKGWVCGAMDTRGDAASVFPFALPLEVAKQYELGIKLKL